MAEAPRTNDLGQPIGAALPDWTPPPFPPHTKMEGRFCRLEPLRPEDAPALWDAFSLDVDGRNWTYLPNGPYRHFRDFAAWVEASAVSTDPQFYTLHLPPGSGQRAHGRGDSTSACSAAGVAAYLRITPSAGVIEVGHIHFSPRLQHTRAATEAMYLMMRHVFELGYRRYEWKCDALNAPSRRAAVRLGFTYEGTFRQALVYKGRNRDTAWYACLDREWPDLRAAFETWLHHDNFDTEGRQRQSLSALTAAVVRPRPSGDE